MPSRCVTALRAKNKSLPALFRSYRSRSISAPDCQIWKVIRATTASPFLFRPITISGGISASTKQTFIAAEEGANNPIKYMKTEYDEIYKKTRPRPPQPGIIVSLGTGKLRGITLEGYTADHKDAEQMMNNVLRQLEKDCEQAHEDFAKGYPRGRNDDGEIIYFRFNVEQGMQDIMDSDWDQDKRIVTETNT